MLEKKLEALKAYLLESGDYTAEELEAIEESGADTLTINGEEYRILTDDEADAAAREEIENSLWAFNADFILQHSTAYEETTDREDEIIIKALQEMQSKLCESAQPIVKALIKDLDEFTADAIDADGRGHFLSYYDGEENEADGFYIYRLN
jgi:hypothetical protein